MQEVDDGYVRARDNAEDVVSYALRDVDVDPIRLEFPDHAGDQMGISRVQMIQQMPERFLPGGCLRKIDHRVGSRAKHTPQSHAIDQGTVYLLLRSRRGRQDSDFHARPCQKPNETSGTDLGPADDVRSIQARNHQDTWRTM